MFQAAREDPHPVCSRCVRNIEVFHAPGGAPLVRRKDQPTRGPADSRPGTALVGGRWLDIYAEHSHEHADRIRRARSGED